MTTKAKSTGATDPPADNDDQIRAAHEAELDRQRLVNEAVQSANQHELPKLGGPMLNPGAVPEAEGKAKS